MFRQNKMELLQSQAFRDPPKIKKNDFLKKPKFFDLSEHGGWSREWPHPP